MKKKLLSITGASLFLVAPIFVASCSNNPQGIQIEFVKTNIALGDKLTLPSQIDKEWIKNKIIQNINTIFKVSNGDYKLFDWENNIEISNLKPNDDEGIISFTCFIKETKLKNTLIFSDFKSNKPTKPNTSLDDKGGKFNNLNIDKYLSVIKTLNLDVDTKLSNLNDANLTNKIHEIDEYKNLSIKIENGSSEREGKLILSLIGNYNEEKIESKIEITGFSNYDTKFDVGLIKINLEEYFDNNQPIIEKNDLEISNNLEIKKNFIKNADFYFNSSYLNKLSYNEMIQKYQLKDLQITKIKNNKLKFVFDFETKFMKYQNNQWTLENEQKKLQQNVSKNSEIDLPSLKDLMRFMIDKFTLKEEELKKYYPSLFKGLFLLNIEVSPEHDILTNLLNFLNYESVIDKYQKTYFEQNQIYPKLDLSHSEALIADDLNNSLSFTINLINDKNPNDLTINKKFESTNLKNINELLEKNREIENKITIKNEDGSTLAKNLKKLFKDDIDKLFKDAKAQKLSLNSSALLQYLKTSWSNIYNFENKKGFSEYIKKIKSNYSLSLFNKNLEERFDEYEGRFDNVTSEKFDVNSGLFTLDGTKEQAFFIENISFEYNDINLMPYIEMTDNTNLVQINFNAEISMSISGSLHKQKASFGLLITKRSWENGNQ